MSTEHFVRCKARRTLGVFNPGTGTRELTINYLTDRAQVLTQKMLVNSSALPQTLLGATYFEDRESRYTIDPLLSFSKLIFGGNDNDPITSGSFADRLYGGAGQDDLSGNAGNDYLEGGMGNDILTGGTGNDTLVGGAERDLYLFHPGDGQGVIMDADRNGLIAENAEILSGGIHKGTDPANLYTSLDGQFTYLRSGSDPVMRSAANASDQIVMGGV